MTQRSASEGVPAELPQVVPPDRAGILVSPEELHAMLGADGLSILDVRWSLFAPDGRPAFREAHVPGAVYVDLDSELAGHGPLSDGRHPLPDIVDFQAAAHRWGVREGGTVVVYDDGANLAAARAWWLLRWGGVSDVRILDGAFGVWRAEGYPTERDDHQPAPGDVTLTPGHLPVIDADGAAALPGHGTLLDVRAPERFRGETEPIDPRAGHVPGAVNAPTGENVDADGRFLPPEELRERFAPLLAADGPIGVYCGSGVTASHTIAALALIGVEARLFPGSWSAWANDPDRPVATENRT